MARPTHPPGPVYDDPSLPGNVHQPGLPPRRIDVLTEISGVDLEGAWSRRSRVEIAGACVPVLDRESLLADERASVRPKDPADLAVPEAGSEAE